MYSHQGERPQAPSEPSWSCVLWIASTYTVIRTSVCCHIRTYRYTWSHVCGSLAVLLTPVSLWRHIHQRTPRQTRPESQMVLHSQSGRALVWGGRPSGWPGPWRVSGPAGRAAGPPGASRRNWPESGSGARRPWPYKPPTERTRFKVFNRPSSMLFILPTSSCGLPSYDLIS